MKLIDADALVEEMRKWYWDTEKQRAAEKDVSPMDLFTNLAITTVKNQPAAYDKEFVIGQLKECIESSMNGANDVECAYWNRAIERAIEIVKGGGVDVETKS